MHRSNRLRFAVTSYVIFAFVALLLVPTHVSVEYVQGRPIPTSYKTDRLSDSYWLIALPLPSHHYRFRLWLVLAVLLCLAVELILLGVVPNPLDVDSVAVDTNGRAVLRRPAPRRAASSKIKLYHHHTSHPPPSYKKAVLPKTGLSLEYLLQGATNTLPAGPIYSDERVKELPGVWGWEPRCMPGYGRSGFAQVSPNLLNFSAIISRKDIPKDIEHYHFAKTVYSNATGEHWTIGSDVGLSVWSCAPVYRYSLVASPSSMTATHISFVATLPTHARDKASVPSLKKDQSNATLPLVVPVRTSKKAPKIRQPAPIEHLDFECIVYTDTGSIILAANVSVGVPHDLVVVTCNTSLLSPAILKQLSSQDSSTPTLALHDKALNIFWNYSKPCNPPRLRADVPSTTSAQSLISNRKYWETSDRVASHGLTAVLIVEAEKYCFLSFWLSRAFSLGFEHIYVYKQVLYTSSPDDVDKLLLPYVQKGLITVVPFFDARDGCNEPYISQRRFSCDTHGGNYYPLYQDAVQRFRAKWMLVADVNEIIFLPHASIASGNTTSKSNSSTTPSTSQSNGLLQALERASHHWGRHTTQASLTGFSHGTGRKQVPRPYCILGDAGDPFNSSVARSDRLAASGKWFLRNQFPFVISEPTMRISPDEVRLNRYLRQFQGALPDNNMVNM